MKEINKEKSLIVDNMVLLTDITSFSSFVFSRYDQAGAL